jgi:hypothetical protein
MSKRERECSFVEFVSTADSGRYYVVFRNIGVIPAIFECYFKGVTCTMGTNKFYQRVEGYLNVVHR